MAEPKLWGDIGRRAGTTETVDLLRAGIAWRAGTVICVLALLVVITSFPGPMSLLPRPAIILLLGIEAAANVGYYFWLRTGHLLALLVWVSLVADIVLITVGVYITGGVASPFTWLYLLVMAYGSFVSWPRTTVAVGGLCVLFLGLSIAVEHTGLVPPQPSIVSLLREVDPGQLDVLLYAIQFVMFLLFGAVAATMSRILYRARLNEAVASVLAGLTTATETKDPSIRGHSERVAALAGLIAQEMGLDVTEVERLGRAGLVHDIGKLYLPDEVLTVEGALSPVQQASLRTHPVSGNDILIRAGTELELAQIVRHHHEWLDGRGYPDGLRGDAIPKGARILAVADALEAMTADRPYRRGLSLAEARVEIVAASGSQFDPEVAAAAVRLLDAMPPSLQAILAARPPSVEVSAAPASRLDGFMTPANRKAAELLYRMALEVTGGGDLSSFLESVLAVVRDVTGCAGGAVYLQDRDSGLFSHQASVGSLTRPTGHGPSDDSILMAAVASRTFRLIHLSAAGPPSSDVEETAGESYRLVTPVFVGGELVAVFDLYEQRGCGFAQELLEVMQRTASQIAAMLDLARSHHEMATAALIDGLTGVNNYRYFRQRLTEELMRCSRHDLPLTVVVIDVDDLKVINDTHGHLAGDEALCRLAHLLRANLRLPDVVARYGGDEFGLILAQTTKPEAAQVVQRVELLMGEAIVDVGHGSIPMPACSIGLASYPEDGHTPDELFAVADRNLYEGKRTRFP